MSAHHAPPDGERVFQPPLPKPALLIDMPAEMALIACELEDVAADVPAEDFAGDLTGVLHLTLVALQNNQLLHRPQSYGSASECHRVARANVELVAFEIDRLGVWPAAADGPRWHLRRCLEYQSLPMLVDVFAKRIREAARRRRMLETAKELERLALSPAPLEAEAA